MKYSCEKHANCVVRHDQIDRVCPVCAEIEADKEAVEYLQQQLEYADADLREAQKDYYDLIDEHKKLAAKIKQLKKTIEGG